jgi:hypothetical protein
LPDRDLSYLYDRFGFPETFFCNSSKRTIFKIYQVILKQTNFRKAILNLPRRHLPVDTIVLKIFFRMVFFWKTFARITFARRTFARKAFSRKTFARKTFARIRENVFWAVAFRTIVFRSIVHSKYFVRPKVAGWFVLSKSTENLPFKSKSVQKRRKNFTIHGFW